MLPWRAMGQPGFEIEVECEDRGDAEVLSELCDIAVRKVIEETHVEGRLRGGVTVEVELED